MGGGQGRGEELGQAFSTPQSIRGIGVVALTPDTWEVRLCEV
jgi:hypothetical protein